MAFEEYAHGTHTYKSLAKLLNDRGYRSRKGGLAIPQQMEKMLKNSLYCGIIRVWDLEQKGTFEPLISRQLFNKCQRSGRKHKSFSMVGEP